ncbi:MAG: DUF4349 domain-containing protein [Anaerolineales bacterium]
MKTRRLILLTMLLALGLAACQPAALALVEPNKETASSGGDGTSANYYGADAPPAAAQVVSQVVDQTGKPVTERLVIRNANLSLVVSDPAAASNQIIALAASLGGYVVTSNTYQASVDSAGNKIMQASLTIRVPSAQLDAALAQLRALSVEVRSETISGQDVTSEYTDLQSHLRNLEAAETKLQQIMDGAVKTEDVLAVYNQLVAIRDQIEQVKGQMQYYEQSAAMSAISADLIADALNKPIEVGGWHPQGVAKDAVEALVRTLQSLADAVIWLGIYVLPIALIILVPLFFFLRFILRRTRKLPETNKP